jgi:hypothetical protein
MTATNDERRNSHALLPELITDPIKKAEAEAANGLLQAGEGLAIIDEALERIKDGNRWRLRPSTIMGLQRTALKGISTLAGTYRPGPVHIEKSLHIPPGAHLVPELVEDLCDYVNDNWTSATAIHLSSYILWRLNWIHPFDDGNGRTSRVTSYVVLMIKMGQNLGGRPTIPDLITQHRKDYFDALDEADEVLKRQRIVDLRATEALMSSLLAKQLASIYDTAGGTIPQNSP